MPTVSVLIPAYRARYLRQAIASVLVQTFEDYELIISDDCPDGSVKAVVDQFGDERIRYIAGPRQGLVANSAHLFDAANTDLLKFVYDDDFLLPFAIARLAGAFKNAPGASFVYSNRHIVAPSGEILGSPVTTKSSRNLEFKPADVVRAVFVSVHNFIGEPTNVLLRRTSVGREALTHYQGYRVRHTIDLAMYLNALDAGTCVIVPEFHAAFRKHREQMSAHSNPAFVAAIYEWDLFARGEYDKGRLNASDALAALQRIGMLFYKDDNIQRYPELAPFKPALAAVIERIQSGGGPALDDAFASAWQAADDAVSARVAAIGR